MASPGAAKIQIQLSFDLIFIFSPALHSGSKTMLDLALSISNLFFFNDLKSFSKEEAETNVISLTSSII